MDQPHPTPLKTQDNCVDCVEEPTEEVITLCIGELDQCVNKLSSLARGSNDPTLLLLTRRISSNLEDYSRK